MYVSIVNALSKAERRTIPRVPCNALKPYTDVFIDGTNDGEYVANAFASHFNKVYSSAADDCHPSNGLLCL